MSVTEQLHTEQNAAWWLTSQEVVEELSHCLEKVLTLSTWNLFRFLPHMKYSRVHRKEQTVNDW
jgi:hypothetical protein